MIGKLTLTAIAIGAVVGCGGQAQDSRPIAGSWFGDIQAAGEHGHSGFAVVSLVPENGTFATRANVTLTGGSAGGNHPWYVHRGQCESEESSAKGSSGTNDPNGSIVGSAADYPTLRPDDSGNASATILIGEQLDTQGEYYVSIHQSADDPTEVGCGNLISNR